MLTPPRRATDSSTSTRTKEAPCRRQLEAPVGWLWASVAGDAMDLALLSAALRQRGAQRDRVRAAMGAVAGITAADVVASVRAGKQNGGFVSPGARLKKSAITVWRPLEQVRESWNDRDLRSPFFFDGEERDVSYAAAPVARAPRSGRSWPGARPRRSCGASSSRMRELRTVLEGAVLPVRELEP